MDEDNLFKDYIVDVSERIIPIHELFLDEDLSNYSIRHWYLPVYVFAIKGKTYNYGKKLMSFTIC